MSFTVSVKFPDGPREITIGENSLIRTQADAETWARGTYPQIPPIVPAVSASPAIGTESPHAVDAPTIHPHA